MSTNTNDNNPGAIYKTTQAITIYGMDNQVSIDLNSKEFTWGKADSEGAILEKTQLLMVLITILSLIGAALGICNLVTASVMERSSEIGLMKAIGAQNSAVSGLVLTEIFITAIFGGVLGFFVGFGFAQIIGHTVFGSAITMKPMVIPITAVLVVLVTLAGSIPAIRMLLRLRPAEVLHGGH